MPSFFYNLFFTSKIYVQVTLTFFRVVMVVVMLITMFVAYVRKDEEFGTQPAASTCSWTCVRLDNLYILLPVAAQAYIFHHSIPSIAHPIRESSRRSMPSVFLIALAISFVAYTALAVSVSLFFDSNTLTPSNLNWVDYQGN